MWLNELKELYLEQGGFGPNTTNQPGPVHGLKGTVDDKNTRGYKGIFGAGGSPPGLYNQAIADGMRLPMGEQEEDEMISKNHVKSLLTKYIDECNDSTSKFYLSKIIKEL
jgi:hypothetical protein